MVSVTHFAEENADYYATAWHDQERRAYVFNMGRWEEIDWTPSLEHIAPCTQCRMKLKGRVYNLAGDAIQ